MYTADVTDSLTKMIENKKLSSFVEKLQQYSEDPAVGPLMNDLQREWRQLQIAKKNGLMDEEQVYFAMRAYFKKKKAEIPDLLKEHKGDHSGNLDT